MTTALTMTKIVVADDESAAAFFSTVCGYSVAQRIEDAHFCEIILQSDAPGAGVLIVIAYFGQPVPPPGASVLVFEMRDIDGFVARAVAAGATVTTPVTRIAALDLAFAMLRDPQGHVFEALQRGGTK